MDRLSSLPALWHRSWNFPHTLPREHPEKAVWRFKGGKKSCSVFQFSVGISAPAVPGREWVSGRTEILVHGFPEFVETGNFSGP